MGSSDLSRLIQSVLGSAQDVSVQESKTIDHQLLSELQQTDELDLKLVYTILLVDLASVDHEFDDREYEAISASITKIFGTSSVEVAQLVRQAKQMLNPFSSTSSFAERLRDELSLEKREELMRVIDQVIRADDRVDGFEIYLRSRLASMLDIDVKPIS